MGDRLNIIASRDVKDNKFLECAVLSKVDYIVSSDEDLLLLKYYMDIKIVNASEMLGLL